MRETRENYVISEEREKEIVEIINKNKKLFSKDINKLKGNQLKKRKQADEAVSELVSAYAPFIEKIVDERTKDAGHYMYDKEDYMSEAYLTAVQNARAFDPSKSKNSTMRFSSYCSRPIASVISRMVAKSRSELNVPSAKMQDARRWAHTLFELSDAGGSVNDKVVSEISGVDSDQNKVMSILNATTHEELNEEISTSSDSFNDYDFEEEEYSLHTIKAIEKAMIEVFGEEEAKEYLIATGVVVYENDGEQDKIVLNVDNVRKPNGSNKKIKELREKLSSKRTFNKLSNRIKKYSKE